MSTYCFPRTYFYYDYTQHILPIKPQTQNNMETKKVTLNNRTELEVGKKYRGEGYSPTEWQEVISIYGEKVLMKDEKGEYDLEYTYYDWLPYTAPTPQKEWKTFLIEVMHHKTGTFYKFPILAESEENARKIHPKAITIEEVK